MVPFANNRLTGQVFPFVGSFHFRAAHQCCDELSANHLRIGRDRANNIGIHDMDKSITTVFVSPTDPIVPRRKIEDRVSQSKEANQTAILSVSNKETESTSETL